MLLLDKSWLQKSPSYRSIISSNSYLQKIEQFNQSTKKTTWVWICKHCLWDQKKQLARPADYMTTPEAALAATIRLVTIEEEQIPEEALTAV